MVLDFSNKGSFPKANDLWEQEILDFIKDYKSLEHIKVQTSGSTGNPKTIILPKSAMQLSAKMTGEFLNLKQEDTALLCMPVHYIAGKMMIVRAIELGLKLYCVEPKTKISCETPIDFGAMTPMQAEASLLNANQNLDIKKLILGGAKVSNDLEQKLEAYEGDVYETYGMTETITHIAMRKLNEEKYFSLLPKIKIRQDERQCLVIKTPYFEEEIYTNDVVKLHKTRQFELLGRVDNIINSGGLKINPEKLENLLQPYISQTFIIHFKEDKTLGQKVILVIESPKPFKVNYPDDLIPKNQQPKEIIFIDKFPRTISGKIIRNKLSIF